MKKMFFVLVTALLVSVNAYAASVFDALYSVSSSGSTVQVTEFDINGPKPWLYVKLPSSPSSLFSSIGSDWLFNPQATIQFSVAGGQSSTATDFWLSPSDTVWGSKESLGEWHVNSNFAWISIQFAENGGIGVGRIDSAGNGVANFTVVPEPGSIALFGIGAGALGLTRLRRKKKTV